MIRIYIVIKGRRWRVDLFIRSNPIDTMDIPWSLKIFNHIVTLKELQREISFLYGKYELFFLLKLD